jgi:hypothetical protein
MMFAATYTGSSVPSRSISRLPEYITSFHFTFHRLAASGRVMISAGEIAKRAMQLAEVYQDIFCATSG